MNKTELDALTQALSNDARVLYCLGLRPSVDLQSGETHPLNYKTLLRLLNGKDHKDDKLRFKLGRQINSLLKELHKAGLIALDLNTSLEKSLNGKSLVLPLVIFKQSEYRLDTNWQTMHADWQPDHLLFKDICTLVGIIEKHYSDDELGEFIAYWLGRPDKHLSSYQWTHKFVMQLKQKRLATSAQSSQSLIKVGSQIIQAPEGISADDNAKALMAKYQVSGSKQSGENNG